jgi:hypothetical protein
VSVLFERSRQRNSAILVFLLLLPVISRNVFAQEAAATELRHEATLAMRRATEFFHNQVASHGGYVYYYSVDLQQRWGEGPATETQIWVQPPGTPTVGLAFLKAYSVTGESLYLRAATDAAEALIYGQLKSGGWTNCIDFNPQGRVAAYRNGHGRGKNYSSLDDGQTQSAIRLMVAADQAHRFQHPEIHASAAAALDALLAAQFPNGAFPQVWQGPTEPQPIVRASYPDYDWRTAGRIKNYWDMYTLNDNVAGYVFDALADAYHTYSDERYLQAIRKLGDFLILAQMPDPQPAWAQQYNFRMRPIWARKFEPPAIAADESIEVISTLLKIFDLTKDGKYLAPIPSALTYLKNSELADGQLARYYELKNNRPLYMKRRGDVYTLTNDDDDVPGHYMWKIRVNLEELAAGYQRRKNAQSPETPHSHEPLAMMAQQITNFLDEQGRWISTYSGERLVGQPKFKTGEEYLSSEIFSRNIEVLSEFLNTSQDE